MARSANVTVSRAQTPRVVYLHVGAPKTGTTYLQTMLAAHRTRLLEEGCFYVPARTAAHHDEARDLRGARPRGGGYHHPAVPGSWERMADRVRAWSGDGGDGVALVSSEILAFAGARQAARAVRSLRPAEVHLVITLRDLVRQIPALWQEGVKNRDVTPYDEFLRRLADSRDPRGPQAVWDGQDPARILSRWGRRLPPERVHLVTVPPRGADRTLLWERFAGVLGIDPSRYPAVPAGANPSLGVAEAEVVRRLNAQTSDAPWRFYARHVKNGIAQGVLTEPSDDDPLVLPESMLPWVQERTAQILAAVSGRGYDVIGDLDDLLPSPDGAGVGPMPLPDPLALAEASGRASGYLSRQLVRSSRRAGGPGARRRVRR